MKIALITDTHFGARNDNLAFNEYFYKFWEEVFFPYLDKTGIDTVIHLGDVMDRRKFVSYKIAKDFRERFIMPFVHRNINLHMLVGNHDTYFKNTNEVNSLYELLGGPGNERYPNIKCYDSPFTEEFDGVGIHLMPWICADNYTQSMRSIEMTYAQICMGHFEINGFEMHKGHYAEGGYDKKFLSKFDTVFSGHFHKKSDDGQIYYLGNTYQMTWSDDNCPKGFHVFDTETRELERIVNPFTIFEKIYYDDSSMDYDKYDISSLHEKFVRIVVVNKKDFYKFDKFVDKVLTESGAHEVKIIEDFSELNAENVDDAIIENAEDTMALLERYISELDVDLDKSRLTNMMKSLYVEASDLEL
jgi:DNA repair exonuclease SbcCD nuclease subunit